MKLKKTLPLLMVLSLFGCSYGCSENNKIQQEDSTEEYYDDGEYEEEGIDDDPEGVFEEEPLESEVEELKYKDETISEPSTQSELEKIPEIKEEAPPENPPSEVNEELTREEPVEDRPRRDGEDDDDVVVVEEPSEEYYEEEMEYEDSEVYPEID